MISLRLALLCALGVLVLTPQAAAGGGWWSYIDVNPTTVSPGQRVEVHASVLLNSAAAGEAAKEPGRFYVYVLRDFDYSIVERAMGKGSPGNWWSLGAAEAIQVGQVGVNVSDTSFGKASATFTVPELPAATYHLMLCDAGCTEPLGDVIPATGFTVVADPATAQIVQRVDHLEQRLRSQIKELANVRTAAGLARVAARDGHSEIKRLRARLSSLADEAGKTPILAFAGWLLAGAFMGASAAVFLRRRRSRPRPGEATGWHPSDEELREVLSSEPTHPR